MYGDVKRIRGWAIVVFVLGSGLLVLATEGYGIHAYGWPGRTANGGLVLDVPNDWYGLELWGSPGFFHHVD